MENSSPGFCQEKNGEGVIRPAVFNEALSANTLLKKSKPFCLESILNSPLIVGIQNLDA